MAEDLLRIAIQSSSEKLKQNFPIDPKGDVQINFKQRAFKLQKAHLRLQSGYFKRVLTANRPILQIAQEFDEDFVSNVLECFYGGTLSIKRTDLLKYYPIVRFLQIDCILKQLQSDIVNHIENYNFFQLFNLAYKYSDQIIFEKCLHQLQHQQFKQLKYEQNEVVKISEQLFKLVIKGHNRQQPSKRLLNAYQIYQLICNYCSTNKISEQHKNQLKFQLIDKVNLTSLQYKHIFLDDVSGDSPRKMPARASSLAQNRTESNINMQEFTGAHSANLTKKKLKLEMNTTFLKKINKQLIQQKHNLVTQLRSLNQITKSQSKKSQQIKQEFKKIRSKIDCDEASDLNIKKQIAKIEKDLKEIQLTMSRQDEMLKELSNSTKQLLDKYQSKSEKTVEKDKTEKNSREKEKDKKKQQKNESFSICEQSFIWQKGPQIQQMYRMIDEKPLKSNTSISSQKNKEKSVKSFQNTPGKVSSKSNSVINLKIQQNIFQNNAMQNRIQFDKLPSVIRTAKQLQSLVQIISTQRFIKKRLTSLYRGSLTDYQENKPNSMIKPNKISNKKKQQLSNLPQKIKTELEYKENVLYVFRTSFNKLVGGFVSVPLNFDIVGDVSDERAYLFSITQGKKFPLKKQFREQAITIQDGYLICFGTDLWISNNLFELQNYSNWPKKYQSVKDKEFQDLDQSKHWFVGDQVFQVIQFEIFEMEDAGSDMIL